MEKIDGRRVKQEVQQALRDQVVRLRRQGKANKDIAEFLGISPPHGSGIWQKYVRGGKKEISWEREDAVMARRGASPRNRNDMSRS